MRIGHHAWPQTISNTSLVAIGQAPRAALATRVVDKMPANFLYAGLIHAAFPKARIIHMRRHPIDTCLSIYFQNFFNMAPTPTISATSPIITAVSPDHRSLARRAAGSLAARSSLRRPHFDEQERWTRRMVDFIGLPWDPRCLDFHATERAVITASKWQVRQKIYAKSAGRWRNYEKHLGPLRRLDSPTPAQPIPQSTGSLHGTVNCRQLTVVLYFGL